MYCNKSRFSRQANAQAQAHPLLLQGIAHLLDAALEKDKEMRRESGCSMSRNKTTGACLDESNHASAITRKGTEKYKTATQTTYRTFLGDVLIQTLDRDEKSDTSQNVASIKKVEL